MDPRVKPEDDECYQESSSGTLRHPTAKLDRADMDDDGPTELAAPDKHGSEWPPVAVPAIVVT
jgi:hypothetical protein